MITTTQTHNFNDSYKCGEDPDQVVRWEKPATGNEYIKKVKFQLHHKTRQLQVKTNGVIKENWEEILTTAMRRETLII